MPLSDLSISSTHQSSFTFYNFYSNILGLSGTLGDEKDIKCIEEIYKAEIIKIPSHEKSNFEEHDSWAYLEENDWRQAICNFTYEVLI